MGRGLVEAWADDPSRPLSELLDAFVRAADAVPTSGSRG